ncbi:Mitochondrial ribosomal L37 isoform 1 [Micractinium conductrix]|uniref:Large ribosomal subunit protein mL54 n=1 Tax=Micractinium conductrix TaxID=554055 RepID=A0A2P6V6E1_9CHLO|nr:Mitochondrial ribosomal L37 isoform 1 [Micractinium conductrix]|eukprot:PSC69655.1 Mitochondrial ribosomal L37 isoform 1 [Micractinium conductrix]
MLVAGRPITQLLSLAALQRGMATLSHEVVTGLDISKKGQDPPLRPDAELPQWLWELAEPAKTLNELRRTKEEELTFEQLERFVKLENRDKIRNRNADRAK